MVLKINQERVTLQARSMAIMNKLIILAFVLLGVFFTLLAGCEGVYIGLFATDEILSEYPWGTELGWSYLNKTNYMLSGLFIALLSWLPLLAYVLTKHLPSKGNTTRKDARLL